MKATVPVLVILALAVISAIVFYQAQRVEDADYMLAVSVIAFGLALVLVLLIPGNKWIYFWTAVAVGGVGIVLMFIVVAMAGFSSSAYHPLSRVAIGLILCSFGAGAAAYFLKKEALDQKRS
jgi:uncharacterized membrane protein YidH (DUF202 family)